MRKTIVMLAVVVGLAGLQMNAEARGGNGGGGNGGGGSTMGTASQGGGQGGMQGSGSMNRTQVRQQLRDGSQAGTSTRDQQRQQLRDQSLHTAAPSAPSLKLLRGDHKMMGSYLGRFRSDCGGEAGRAGGRSKRRSGRNLPRCEGVTSA